jgi:predicted AlkP superfamily phosphohydrolase/phosphomutase
VKRKVIIFGVDGGTFNVLAPLLAAGELPHFGRMQAAGAAGELASVVPPLTAPAWATFQTGLNPGRHGVFDFLAPPRLGYNRRLHNAAALASLRIFDALTAAGRTVGAVNVPLTFPPRAVNGFVVPGLLTPAVKPEYFYPPELVAEIKSWGEYYIDLNPAFYEEGRDEEFLADLARVSAARFRVALRLWETKRPDFFIVVFTGVDRLMHFFWDRPALVREHYRWLDGALGEFLRRGEREGATVIALSDHGFGPVVAEADLAAHLREGGWLRLRPRRGPTPRRFMDAVARLDVFGWRKKLPGRLRDAARGKVMERFSAFAGVDWSRTVAFPGTATQYGLYLNVAGREPEGIVARADYARVREEIIASLDGLRAGLGRRALRREDVYFGPALDDAPDCYLPLWEDGVRLAEFSDDPAVAPRRRRPGEHRREGIFFALGPDIRPGAGVADAGLGDVFPTVMYLMDEAVPAGLDGRVLTELFSDERLRRTPPAYGEYGDAATVGYAAEEDAAVRERLRSMGYLG